MCIYIYIHTYIRGPEGGPGTKISIIQQFKIRNRISNLTYNRQKKYTSNTNRREAQKEVQELLDHAALLESLLDEHED